MGFLKKLFSGKNKDMPASPADSVNEVVDRVEPVLPVGLTGETIADNVYYTLYIEKTLTEIKKLADNHPEGTSYGYYCWSIRDNYLKVPIERYSELVGYINNMLDFFTNQKNIKYECLAFYNYLRAIMLATEYSGQSVAFSI